MKKEGVDYNGGHLPAFCCRSLDSELVSLLQLSSVPDWLVLVQLPSPLLWSVRLDPAYRSGRLTGDVNTLCPRLFQQSFGVGRVIRQPAGGGTGAEGQPAIQQQ